MPSGFGDNKEDSPIKKPFTNNDDLDDISKITEMLNPDERVLLVARQSRIKPGGSHFTPNIIYAANRRIIVRSISIYAWNKRKRIVILYNKI
jgi:hypothetical protein